MQTWHVVYATGMIQAVYGGALRDMALDKARDIRAQVGLFVDVATVQCPTRPRMKDPYPIPGARVL